MSRTFVPRPAVSQRGRGRERGETNSTQPSVRGESVSPSRGTSVRGRGAVGQLGGSGSGNIGLGGSGFAGGAVGRGSSTSTRPRGGRGAVSRGSRGGKMYQPGMNQDMNQDDEGPANSAAGDSVQGRATYAGGYTVISPDEKKRQKVLEQAARETQQYEEYRQRNKPTKFSYVGTAGGGEVGAMDEASARMQQIQMHNMHSKTNKLLKNQERKGQLKQLEDQELEKKKAEARKKADMNSQREAQRANTARSDMRRVNNAFLDRLEAQSRDAAATGAETQQQAPQPQQQRANPSGPPPSRYAGQQFASSSQSGHHTTSNPAGQRTTSKPAGQPRTSDPAAGRGSQMTSPQSSTRPQPGLSQSRVATSSTLPSYHSDRYMSTESHPQPASDSFEEQPADSDEFFNNLQQLVNMFPHFDEGMLHNILEQCNGSLDHALDLLE